MKIESAKLIRVLQDQLTFERYSADIYYGLACQLDSANLVGMAAYMHKREAEERGHARKFSDYLADRFITPEISEVANPSKPLPGDPLAMGAAAFGAALEHERLVTGRIRMLSEVAFDESDPETGQFLLWFLAEQVEEERSLDEILTKFKLAAGNGAAILLIDHELGG